jgi:hypothetical protein
MVSRNVNTLGGHVAPSTISGAYHSTAQHTIANHSTAQLSTVQYSIA